MSTNQKAYFTSMPGVTHVPYPNNYRVRYVRGSRDRREEDLLFRVLARREGERPHRPAVKAAEKAEEAAAARHVTRQLERRLHALGARLREETHHRLFHRREFVDPLAQADLSFVPVVRRYMQETIRRILDGLHHRRMTMSRAAHRDAGRKVQKTVSVDVPDFGPLAVRHHEGVVPGIGWRSHQRIAGQ